MAPLASYKKVRLSEHKPQNFFSSLSTTPAKHELIHFKNKQVLAAPHFKKFLSGQLKWSDF